jgi:poly-gamma-glutamate capsule biosynthesis protein CapA/YwtB (metallophosphatase superfamily)
MSVTIALAGDTMLGRGVGAEIAKAGTRRLFSRQVRERVASADLVLLNLECCISERGDPWDRPTKLFHFRAPPQAADALADLGVSCVTLANNHALDYGYTALTDTIGHLSGAGILVAGAGADVHRARAPVVLEACGLTVAVLGVTDHPADFAATTDRPGVAYADLECGVPAWLTRQLEDAAGEYDVVLVMPHWGPNMATGPLPYIRSAAQSFTKAGATLVAGSSAHVFQGVAGRVIYDLGGFIDDYGTDAEVRNDLGLLFLVTLDARTLRRVEAVPLKLRYARTGLATGADRAWISTRLTRACAAFGTSVRDQDGRITLRMQERTMACQRDDFAG